jgi:hypothetical protein
MADKKPKKPTRKLIEVRAAPGTHRAKKVAAKPVRVRAAPGTHRSKKK